VKDVNEIKKKDSDLFGNIGKRVFGISLPKSKITVAEMNVVKIKVID
jgi:hypothetical protein